MIGRPHLHVEPLLLRAQARLLLDTRPRLRLQHAQSFLASARLGVRLRLRAGLLLHARFQFRPCTCGAFRRLDRLASFRLGGPPLRFLVGDAQ